MTNLDMRNMQDHYPHRDDQVAAWIKDRRDAQPEPEDGTRHLIGEGWTALDNLLDEYRLAADTGQSLEVVVNGEPERPPRGAPKKPTKTELFGGFKDDENG